MFLKISGERQLPGWPLFAGLGRNLVRMQNTKWLGQPNNTFSLALLIFTICSISWLPRYVTSITKNKYFQHLQLSSAVPLMQL